jgi:hypothetical protein
MRGVVIVAMLGGCRGILGIETPVPAHNGFTERVVSSPDKDVIADRTVATTGSYDAGVTLTSSSEWIMQLVAFKGAN